MGTRRRERVGELIREEISELIRREVKDPRLSGLISVTAKPRVLDLTPDKLAYLLTDKLTNTLPAPCSHLAPI